MSETVHTAASELQHPGRFLREAAGDLRRSVAPAWQLFRRNMQVRYRRAGLGYLWLLLPTVGTTLVWVYVQSRRIIDVAPTDVPYPVYVLTGTILWQVFVDALNAPLQQLTASRQLITRSRVPHEALILAATFEVLLNCAVRLVILVPVLFFFRASVGPAALLVPVGVAALLLFGLALGLFAAPLGMLYDDVGRGITLVTGFLFFLTPVIYRTPSAGILRFNPLTPLLDTTRAWLTGGEGRGGFAAVTAVTLLALVLAWLFERLARPHMVARLG
ncbi:MAG TPA: ABC transporter permease [Thermoanaerobaculia bacterium]